MLKANEGIGMHFSCALLSFSVQFFKEQEPSYSNDLGTLDWCTQRAETKEGPYRIHLKNFQE